MAACTAAAAARESSTWRTCSRATHRTITRNMATVHANFYRRVEEAIANQTLQGALDRATARMQIGRANGARAFPEFESVRDRAREIRARTIGHLDAYLEQFVHAVEARGGTVF